MRIVHGIFVDGLMVPGSLMSSPSKNSFRPNGTNQATAITNKPTPERKAMKLIERSPRRWLAP